MSADQARTTIWAMGTSPGFDATFAATLDRRYLAGPRIDAPVTLAFGSRDLVLLPHQSRHLDQLLEQQFRQVLGARLAALGAAIDMVPGAWGNSLRFTLPG